MLVACRVPPNVVDEVVVCRFRPAWRSREGIWRAAAPFKPLAGVAPLPKQSATDPRSQGCVVGRVAVLGVLIEHAQRRGALRRPGRRDVEFAGQVGVADTVGRGLRRGVDRAPVLLQQFDGRGRGGAERVVRRADIEVDFVASSR